MKVADVGDAKVLLTSRNTAVGTPFFVAPEVGRGRYTTKADVFSVGMSMVETVLRCLVDGGGALVLNSLVYMGRRDDMVADAAARVESRCPELCELLRECCAAEPEDRPDAATAMRRVATLCAKQRLRERLGEVIAMEDGSDVRVDAGEVEREGLRLADDVIVALHRKLTVSLPCYCCFSACIANSTAVVLHAHERCRCVRRSQPLRLNAVVVWVVTAVLLVSCRVVCCFV